MIDTKKVLLSHCNNKVIISQVLGCFWKQVKDMLIPSYPNHRNHHHLVLFPLRKIGPCVLSLQASRSFAQLLASLKTLNPSSQRSLSTVLRYVSFGVPLLRLPTGVHVKTILVFSFTLFLSTFPISFQGLWFIC